MHRSSGSRRLVAAGLTAFWLLACGDAGSPQDEAAPGQRLAPPVAAGRIDHARLANAGSEPGSWLAHGRTWSEQRFSPLDQINAGNVAGLGLTWSFDLGSTRGVETTPIVVDGVMYVTAPWSIVFALNAKTGEQLWKYDPQVPREWGRYACCDVVNRGAAVWKGSVFVGTLDGRLVSIDAGSGELNWEVQTFDKARPYTITGAPRVVKDRVVIGNGGAELGVRGYVTAYDAATGEQSWRFYTVPGDPSLPFEHAELEQAAKTWTGEWWKVGGGGTAWDAMAFDPELDLLYIGTGNGAPWTRYARSPGGGDNLYLSSILAVRPDTGELVWHYQTTPGDNWDYTATQHIMLAELPIGGETRKVLMQAPKNGFFYVLDRATGELLSAESFAAQNWATHVDMKTGRPVETVLASYEKEARKILPGPQGAHSWHPMAFSPKTGLVYIPSMDLEFWFTNDAGFEFRKDEFNLGLDVDRLVDLSVSDAPSLKGQLLAWDPVAGKEVWRVAHQSFWNGGVLATAGDLIFQGTGDGRLVGYRASSGKVVWEVQSQTGILAAPISYAVDDEQYLAVAVGWGGGVIATGRVENAVIESYHNEGRILAFRLGASLPLPRNQVRDLTVPAPPALTASETEVAHGKSVYNRLCMPCHGFAAASSLVVPDLRLMSADRHVAFEDIVARGILAGNGMPRFGQQLGEGDLAALHGYVISQAQEAYADQAVPSE